MSTIAQHLDATQTRLSHSQVESSRSPRLGQFRQPGMTQETASSNQVVQRFAQTCPLRLPAPGSCPFGGICHSCPARLQAKLTVSQPGDEYEQEADRVADQVMRMPEPCSSCGEEERLQTKPLAKQVTPLIQREEDKPEEEEESKVQPKLSTDTFVQRQEEPEEEEEPVQTKMLDTAQAQRQEESEEEEEEPIQTKRSGEQPPQDSPSLAAQIHSLQGGGQPLPQSTRDFFEPRFGRDFSNVRIHTDVSAARAASAIDARAFTLGSDVVFGPGQYAPQTPESNSLLAHELTHVIQQSSRLAPHASSQWKKERVQTREEESVQMQRQAEPEKDDEESIQAKPIGEPIMQRTPDLEAMQHYEGCEGDQNFFIELAQTRAPQWVASTIDSLRESLRPHDIVTAADSTLNRFFRPPPGGAGTIGGRHRPETVQNIIGNLDRMLPVLQNPRTFRCVTRETCRRENPERPNAHAYTRRGARISICPSFFDLGTAAQITRLIHESAQRIGLSGEIELRETVMGLSLNAALRNAQSYALLVTENVNGSPRAARHAPREEEAPACPYPGCRAEGECPVINQALADARDLISGAMRDLRPATRGQPLTRRRTRDALQWHFRIEQQIHPDIRWIYETFESIQEMLSSNPAESLFNCTRTGSCATHDFLAYIQSERLLSASESGLGEAIYTGHPPIYICQQRFFDEDAHERALVVIHEAAHLVGLGLGPHPEIYDHNARAYRALSSEAALETPDAYANFAYDNRYGVPVSSERDIRLTTGVALQSGEPQFYVTLGATAELSHPILRIFNPVAGIYVTYMPGTGAVNHRVIGSVDVGLRLAVPRPSTGIYIDVRGGGFAGFEPGAEGDEQDLAGISARLGAGYRSERLDLGVDFEYWHNFLSEHPQITLVGVRLQVRY